ncbi:hypothetical protein GFM44_39060 [Rhizobium leguminosarum bv. viciae]|nr:hypothetical protein [Rhizobium leguminosarum bv. viciae]
MSEASFFTDMLQSITDRGRQLLFSGARATQVAAKVDLQTLEGRRGGNGQRGSRPFAQIMNSTLGGGRK